jgi:cytochrome c-type biogenesis protein
MFAESVSYPAAFLAGLLSFLSPCILPLIPAYFTFITGYSVGELTDADNTAIRKKVILATLAYVFGFGTIFVLLGASASYVGGLAAKYSTVIRVVGGLLILVLGAHLAGFLRLPGLSIEKRLAVSQKPVFFGGTFLVGMAFGAGWSPCIGPLLGSILVVAGNQASVVNGMLLLGVYSAGLALPFLAISVGITYMLKIIKRLAPVQKYVSLVAGILLMVVGLLLIFGWLRYV